MIKHIGFGVNGFSVRDPFAGDRSATQVSDAISATAETVPAGETCSADCGANPLNEVALEAACRAYARRWMPSDSPEYTRQARVHVEYIILSYLDMARDCQAVQAKPGSDVTDSEGNARLTAAAPEMLAALQAMLRHSCVADAHPSDKDAEDHDAERAARAAIAKATS